MQFFTGKFLSTAVIRQCCWGGLLLAATTTVMAADEEERKLPDPEDVTLETVDKVSIKGTYWEPKEPGKSTVPIILLHGWGGKRQEYDVLGRTLQEQFHHAVLSIDLRGHGGSTVRRPPASDKDEIIDPDKMARQDFEAMIAEIFRSLEPCAMARIFTPCAPSAENIFPEIPV